MPHVHDFTPLREESVLAVRARIDADTNAGIAPSDSAFIDTSEGTVYFDMTQGVALEIERLWDFAATEMVAASFPAFAWGEYLDLHGDTLSLLRKDSVRATGYLRLTGTPGTLVATGYRASTVQTDPDLDPLEFISTGSAVLAVSPGPTGLGATPSGTGGTLVAGTYYYVVTAETAGGETVISNEVYATVTGATSKIDLAWSTVAGATGYRVYRSTSRGLETLLADLGVVLLYADTGAATPGADKPPTNLVPIEAVDPGIEGNVSAGSITQPLTPIAGVVSITNPEATTGGAEVESDDLYRDRILLEYSTPQGAGNVGDYIRWALAYSPIGYATIEPLWNGAGTVRVIVTDRVNQPVTQAVVDGLQEVLDPLPGLGAGLAPIGAIVTVATPASLTINVAATLTLDTDYSLDGTGGTIAVRADVEAALAEYINALRPGEDVILEHAKSQFFAVAGVKDISGVTLNGSAANVPVGPPGAIQVAQLGSVTLA